MRGGSCHTCRVIMHISSSIRYRLLSSIKFFRNCGSKVPWPHFPFSINNEFYKKHKKNNRKSVIENVTLSHLVKHYKVVWVIGSIIKCNKHSRILRIINNTVICNGRILGVFGRRYQQALSSSGIFSS